MKTLTALAAVVALATPAAAEVERFELSTHGDWGVSYSVDTDTNYEICMIESSSVGESVMQIAIDDGGDYYLKTYQYDPSATGAPFEVIFPLKLRIRADYMDELWVLNGTTHTVGNGEINSFFSASQGPELSGFLSDFMAGSLIAVVNVKDEQTPLSIWSLDGSTAALGAMLDCSKRITGEAL